MSSNSTQHIAHCLLFKERDHPGGSLHTYRQINQRTRSSSGRTHLPRVRLAVSIIKRRRQDPRYSHHDRCFDSPPPKKNYAHAWCGRHRHITLPITSYHPLFKEQNLGDLAATGSISIIEGSLASMAQSGLGKVDTIIRRRVIYTMNLGTLHSRCIHRHSPLLTSNY